MRSPSYLDGEGAGIIFVATEIGKQGRHLKRKNKRVHNHRTAMLQLHKQK